MPADHVISAHALELAVHGRPEPTVLRAGGKSWRTLASGKGWHTASTAGSSNIPGEASAALLAYASPGRERAEAVELNLERYGDVGRRFWWLAEPDSVIYCGKLESATAGVVLLAERLGERELADAARRELRESAERSCLMRAVLRSDHLAPNPKSSADDRDRYLRALRRNVGKLIACRAGCRSWGSVLHVESPMTSVAQHIFDGRTPKGKGNVGDIDGSDITARVIAHLWPIFREAFEDARRMATAELVAAAERHWSPARGPFQYLGWRDGSRLCVMGRDEEGFVDEDTNSNTPGIMAFGVLRGRLVALPEWPAPNSGSNHVRQVNTFGDVDLAPDLRSLTLLHSHVGRESVRAGGRDLSRTRLDLPDPGDRIFHLLSEPGKPWRSLLAALPPAEPPVVIDPPVDPGDDMPPPAPPRKRSLWQRLKEWFRRHVLRKEARP